MLAITALPITINTPLLTPLPILYPNLSSLGGLEKEMTVVCAVHSYGGNRCGGGVLFFAGVEQNCVLVRDNIGVITWCECCGACDYSAKGGCGSVAW